MKFMLIPIISLSFLAGLGVGRMWYAPQMKADANAGWSAVGQ